MTGMSQWFVQRRRVGPADIDAQRHVNNVVYVEWLQEIAVAHWEALAPPAVHATVGWVAVRHEIDYHIPGLLDDEVEARTRVGHAEGLRFERLTEFARVSDGRVLARARTLWVPIDRRTGRPMRVGPEVRSLVSVDD